MGRMYTVGFENVSVSAAQEFFVVIPAANKPCKLHAIILGNSGGQTGAGSAVGDAQEEDLRILVRRYTTATITAASGGTTPTPQPLDENDAAAGFTSRVNGTTLTTTSGASQDLHFDGWNIRVPFVIWFTPETRPRVQNTATGSCLVVRLVGAPVDAIKMSGTIYVEEL